MVRFGCFASAAWVQVLGVDLHHLSLSGHAVVAAHIQKEEDWQQMLAQGESSTAKNKQSKNPASAVKFAHFASGAWGS